MPSQSSAAVKTTPVEDIADSPELRNIIAENHYDKGGLIRMLQEIQARFSYLPTDALRAISEQTGRPLVDVYAVATFYKSFSLTPRGKHLCSVCLGTACHVRGAPKVFDEFSSQLRIDAGQTTEDGVFSLETVNCLGACALGPVVVVDGHYFSGVRSKQAGEIIEKSRNGLNNVHVKSDRRVFPVEVSCSRCNHNLMDPTYLIDGYPSIRVTISLGRKHGWLRLSSLYGSYSVESEFDLAFDQVVHFFCPHCHSELSGAMTCVECSSPMVPMIVRGGGIVQICSRHGCRGHLLDVA